MTAPLTVGDPPLTFSIWVGGIIRRWSLVAKVVLLALLFAAIAAIVVPPVYVSGASFFASSSSASKMPAGLGGAGLSGLAENLGVGSLGSDPSESPLFYVQLIQSRELRTRLALSWFLDYRTEDPRDSTQLVHLLGIRASEPKRKVEMAIKRIQATVSSDSDPKTNLVGISVKSRWPELSAAVANRTVELVTAFNREQRTSRARSKRLFLQGRLDSAQYELRMAEETQRSFHDQNRQWRNSPSLAFEEGRLTRSVEMATDLYLTLRRQFEAARLDEFNDAALITVVDSAVPPRKAEWPRYGVLLTTTIAVGTIIGILVAGSVTILEDWRKRNPAAASFLRESWARGPRRRRRRKGSPLAENATLVQ